MRSSSSDAKVAIPLTQTLHEASTGQSATGHVLREGGWPPHGGSAAALGHELHDASTASWIDHASRLARPDARGLLDALDDGAFARERRLRSAELELLHKRALLEALGDEQMRLRDDVARLEEALIALDADMHLALARDREDLARAAILRIIPQRRRITVRRAGVDRIEKERQRLAAIVARQAAALGELRAQVATTPPPIDSASAQQAPGPPRPLVSSEASAPRGRHPPTSSRERRKDPI